MRTLAFTFNVNGVVQKVALRKKIRERRYQAVVNGDVLEYAFTDQNKLEQVNGPILTQSELQQQIEKMIQHYFGKNQP